MREKIISIMLIFIFLLVNFPLVESYQFSDGRLDKSIILESDLPDLICNYIGCVDFDGNDHYGVEFSISNIGDTIATEWSVELHVFYLGGLLFHNLGFDPSKNEKIGLFLMVFCHFNTLSVISSRISQGVNGALLPGETKEFNSWFAIPMPHEKFRTNGNIAIVFEVSADPEMDVEESNEQNNQDIVRWWFPLKNDPPIS